MRRGRSGYGQKGGIGPTAGRTAATYEVTFPDGTTARKRSYFVDADEATIGCYLHEGKWYAAGVCDRVETLPDGRQVAVYGHHVTNQLAIVGRRVK